MSADKDVGGFRGQYLFHAWIIARRCAPDVRHPNPQALAFEAKVFREPDLYALVVDVAIDAAQWFEIFQRLHDFYVAEVAPVPHLIAALEMEKDFWIKKSMRV